MGNFQLSSSLSLTIRMLGQGQVEQCLVSLIMTHPSPLYVVAMGRAKLTSVKLQTLSNYLSYLLCRICRVSVTTAAGLTVWWVWWWWWVADV